MPEPSFVRLRVSILGVGQNGRGTRIFKAREERKGRGCGSRIEAASRSTFPSLRVYSSHNLEQDEQFCKKVEERGKSSVLV